MKLNKEGRAWLRKRGACEEVYKWACENCATLDDVWATARPDWLIWVATHPGCLDDRTLRLFAVWCARQVQHLMDDERSIAALDVAERFANGEATSEELAAAGAAAGAAWDARAASWVAAMAAARAAAGAAWVAAWDAAEAAMAAAMAAARDARDTQAAKLREMATPNWGEV